MTHHESLLHIWNDYYSEWIERTTFPSLVVRYEDLLYQPEHVMKEVCECYGSELKPNFRFFTGSAKILTGPHIGGAGLIDALIKYGNDTRRKEIIWYEPDLEYAKKEINGNLVKMFKYRMP